MKIFSNDNIRRIGDMTIEREGISMLDLMERAASAITFEIMARWRVTKRIVVFAGPGDNGGDALAVSRMLAEQGYAPEVFLFNTKSTHLSKCCAVNRDRLREMKNVNFNEVTETFDPPELGENDVVIDGLFGSGLRPPLKGGYTALVEYINNSDAYIVAIDIPSGLLGEWNEGLNRKHIVKADLTLTYQFERLSFFFAENSEFIGECKVLDMEMSPEAIADTTSEYFLVDRRYVHNLLQPRDPFTTKDDYGSVLLVAGSYGMMGAAIMAARAVMRAGAGMVTVHAPRCGYVPLQTAVPEALFEADRNELMTTAIDMKSKFSVVAIGPGIGHSDETVDAVDTFLKSFRMPCLIDADALNCIARRPILLRSIHKGSVITPHEHEFDRLFGKHDTYEERLKKAIEVSRLYDITIVLKGHYSMVVRPDGRIFINSSGNAGMATAGSGDVLTGIIAGLIAQNYPPSKAVPMGVYLHGLAGDIAAREHGTYGVTASDIVDNIGRAFREVITRNE